MGATLVRARIEILNERQLRERPVFFQIDRDNGAGGDDAALRIPLGLETRRRVDFLIAPQ